jgi:exopolysaccharide production protein ExoQ
LNTHINRRFGRPLPPPAARAPLEQPAAPVQLPASVRRWEADKRSSFIPVVLITLLILIMVVPQGLEYSEINDMPNSADALSKVIWLVLSAGAIYLLARNTVKVVAFIKKVNPWLLAFAVLATLSVVWSIDLPVTLRRLNRVYVILGVCISFTLVAWHPKRFQNVMRTMLTLVLIASVIFIYYAPELSIHHRENHPELMNAWHGITTGKNIFGSLSSAAFLLWLHAWLSKEAARFYALAGMALAGTCLVMSRSSTSIMATAFATVFMLIMLRSPGSMRRYLPYFVGTFAAIILVYICAVLHLVPGLDAILTPITAITGKDLTFTGRTNIWYILNLHIRLHPLLGTGYGAYWVGPFPTSPSYEMVAWLYFYPTEGHNGYLDVVNDLGLVGGVILLLYFANYVSQSLKLLRLDRYQAGLYLTLLFRGFIADLSESHWFSVLSVDFVIMTLATTCLTRSLLMSRAERARERANA